MDLQETTDIQLLRTAPTEFLWEVELQRILDGQRENSILRLESVESYINKNLVLSKDPPCARVFFQNALRQTVRSWQPNDLHSKEYLACMLEMLSAYTPAEGSSKVLSFLKRWGGFSSELPSVGGFGANYDLTLQALVVMESYFQLPPDKVLKRELDNFVHYTEVLKSFIIRPDYAAYAVGRLIDLEILTFGQVEVRELVQTIPMAIPELLSFLFVPTRRASLSDDLSDFLSHFEDVSENVIQVLVQASSAFGAQVIRSERGLAIKFENHIFRPSITTKLKPGPHVRELDTSSQLKELLLESSESAERTISETFEHYLLAGSSKAEKFEKELKSCGASLKHDPSSMNVTLEYRDRVFQVRLTNHGRVAYYGWRLNYTNRLSQQEAIKKATSSVSQGN